MKLQQDCGVADLKMSDYGIQKEECMTLAVNATGNQWADLFFGQPPAK